MGRLDEELNNQFISFLSVIAQIDERNETQRTVNRRLHTSILLDKRGNRFPELGDIVKWDSPDEITDWKLFVGFIKEDRDELIYVNCVPELCFLGVDPRNHSNIIPVHLEFGIPIRLKSMPHVFVIDAKNIKSINRYECVTKNGYDIEYIMSPVVWHKISDHVDVVRRGVS